MDYTFEISLPDSPDFRCEIAINGEQTFQHFHDKIVEVLSYDNSQMASFFTLDRLGNRKKEIALMEMSVDEEETDTLVMDSTKISDIVKPGCLELEYVFDFFGNRYFKVEYAGEYNGDSSDVMPLCVFCQGKIPAQFSFDTEKEEWALDDDDDSYKEDYDDSFMDEFDNGGFDDDEERDKDYDDEFGSNYESLDDYIDKL